MCKVKDGIEQSGMEDKSERICRFALPCCAVDMR